MSLLFLSPSIRNADSIAGVIESGTLVGLRAQGLLPEVLLLLEMQHNLGDQQRLQQV